MDLSVVKTGRLLFAVAHIRPEAGITVLDLDRLRRVLQTGCESVFAAVKTEIIFTGNRPFDEGSSIRSEAGIG